MSQSTARHDPRREDEEVAQAPVRRPEHKQRVRPDAGDPDEGEFELIGDDDLGPADLGPAAPNVRDPDADSGRIRKITGKE